MNLVESRSNLGGFMIFLPNSDHSYHSTWIQAEYVGEGKVLHLVVVDSW